MLRDITLVIKQLLARYNLNSAYHGGLGNYALVIWVTACLIEMNNSTEDLGEILLFFLNWYGYMFNPIETGIHIFNSHYRYCICSAYY